MIPQIASFAAVFVYQAAQPPVVIQLQAPPDPWWKWLLQFCLSGVPVGGGVLVAWMAFQWTKKKEHEQWIRDRSEAEWKDLVQRVAKIEHEIPVIIKGLPDHQGLEAAIMCVLPELRGTLFVYSVLESSGYIEKWQELLRYASGRFLLMTGTNRAVQTGTLGEPVSLEDRERWDKIGSHEEVKIRTQFHELVAELRALAHANLKR
ncbi:MAG: hypothetical protein ACLGPM_08990 [Acidobacteriota bacterium]